MIFDVLLKFHKDTTVSLKIPSVYLKMHLLNYKNNPTRSLKISARSLKTF